jgi:CheY-like chemotaxis protein
MMTGSAEKSASSPASPRILVVDDSSVARRQLRQALEAVGISVSEASEGVEALWRGGHPP